jgi:hypothetical protein
LGAPPTEDDVERSPLIIEAIRHSSQNADAFTYEMFDKYHARDQSHTAYYVNSKGETLRIDDVNVSAASYRLLPMRDQLKYGNYCAILRRRPGATAITTPEYRPNAVYSFHEVNSDFRRAEMTLLHSRMWTEAPLNNFKLTHIYPYADYIGGNKIYINKINQSLNLGRIPYKTELVYDAMPAERSKTGRSQPVKPRETMERLIELGILPNDNKATLDEYLDKLKGNIEKLEQYQSRISFATGQMLIDAQLRRLISLETTIRHIAEPRLTYGRKVNTLPTPAEVAPNAESLLTREAVSPPSATSNSPWNDSNPTTDSKDISEDEQDRQDPQGLGSNN